MKLSVVVVVWKCGSANLRSHPVLVYQGPTDTSTHSTILYYSILLYTTADIKHIHTIAILPHLYLHCETLRTFEASPQSTPNRLPARSLIHLSLSLSLSLFLSPLPSATPLGQLNNKNSSMASASSIKANCRKVICIGRNYAYDPSQVLPHYDLRSANTTKRPHRRTQQHQTKTTFLLPEAPILDPLPRRRPHPAPQGNKPTL